MPRQPRWSTWLLCISILWIQQQTRSVDGWRCLSCARSCIDGIDCDCDDRSATATDGDGGICEGEFCYAKLDRFDDNQTLIRKGCVDSVLEPEALNKCQYINDDQTIECYCGADDCNVRRTLNDYRVDADADADADAIDQEHAKVQCCECEGYDYENQTIDCLSDACLRNCTGDFCFYDAVTQAQGCGRGRPKLQQLTRKSTGNDRSESCVSAYSDLSDVVRGCTCTEDWCNMQRQSYELMRNDTESRVSDLGESYCYALKQVESPTVIDGPGAFRRSTTCPGHFCFVSWSSAQIYPGTNGTGPQLRPYYSLSAGCLMVNNDTSAELGCTTEWTDDRARPVVKHCVCRGHLCNYFNLISGQDRRLLLAFDWRTRGNKIPAQPIMPLIDGVDRPGLCVVTLLICLGCLLTNVRQFF